MRVHHDQELKRRERRAPMLQSRCRVSEAKAAGDSRTPKPGGGTSTPCRAIASWSAAVLCRFVEERREADKPQRAITSGRRFSNNSRIFQTPLNARPAICINTPLQWGVTTPGSATTVSTVWKGFEGTRKPLKRLSGNIVATFTPLKRGVNEKACDPSRFTFHVSLLTSHSSLIISRP
jgi:hypothetical protein